MGLSSVIRPSSLVVVSTRFDLRQIRVSVPVRPGLVGNCSCVVLRTVPVLLKVCVWCSVSLIAVHLLVLILFWVRKVCVMCVVLRQRLILTRQKIRWWAKAAPVGKWLVVCESRLRVRRCLLST